MFTIKISFNGELRRRSFKRSELTYQALRSALKEMYHTDLDKCTLHYVDDDRDRISICSDPDLIEALQVVHATGLLKVEVSKGSSPVSSVSTSTQSIQQNRLTANHIKGSRSELLVELAAGKQLSRLKAVPDVRHVPKIYCGQNSLLGEIVAGKKLKKTPPSTKCHQQSHCSPLCAAIKVGVTLKPPHQHQHQHLGKQFQRYVLMKQVGVPDGAIRMKMQANNESAKDIARFLGQAPAAPRECQKQFRPQRYVMMRQVGLSDGAIRMKMLMNNESAEAIALFLGEAINLPSYNKSRWVQTKLSTKDNSMMQIVANNESLPTSSRASSGAPSGSGAADTIPCSLRKQIFEILAQQADAIEQQQQQILKQQQSIAALHQMLVQTEAAGHSTSLREQDPKHYKWERLPPHQAAMLGHASKPCCLADPANPALIASPSWKVQSKKLRGAIRAHKLRKHRGAR
jgi:hypothetical protein